MTDLFNSSLTSYRQMNLALGCLSIYHQVLNDPAVGKMADLIRLLADPDAGLEAKITAYSATFRAIAEQKGALSWPEALVHSILADENIFTRTCAETQKRSAGSEAISFLAPAILEDLNTLQTFAGIDASRVKEYLRQTAIKGGNEWALSVIGKLPEWLLLPPHPAARKRRRPNSVTDLSSRLLLAIDADAGWSDLYSSLIPFHRSNGYGDLAFYRSFTVEKGRLVPIPEPDPIDLDDLVDYEGNIARARQNAVALLEDRDAENVLLIGARGTGKSSTVKAIAKHYSGEGLRLIEMTKRELSTLPRLFKELAHLNLSFIIFIDDLSFEKADDDYTMLKNILQGGSTRQPANIAFYVTSNRRHLIAERFVDTEGDLFENDVRHERLSLSERFGLTLNYRTPLQSGYLDIVRVLAARLDHGLDEVELQETALAFSTRQGSRSPRTARQFIDQLNREF